MHWRRLRADTITREDITSDYIALYWTENSTEMSRGVGVAPKYLMKLKSSNFMETRHPFTSFTAEGYFQEIHNHVANDDTVTKAAVIRVFNNLRKPQLFDPQNEDKSLIFIGSGSTVNVMIDALSFAMMNVKCVKGRKIVFLYSTRDRALHTWVKSAFYSMVADFERRNKDIRLLQNLEIVLFCTAKDSASFPLVLSSFDDASIVDSDEYPDLDDTMYSFVSDENEKNETSGYGKHPPSSTVKIMYTRINMGDTISNNSIVFCQGSKAFVESVRKQCKSKKNVKFHYD